MKHTFIIVMFIVSFFTTIGLPKQVVGAEDQPAAGACVFTYQEKTICANDFSQIPMFEKDTNNFNQFCRLGVCTEDGVSNCSFQEGKVCADEPGQQSEPDSYAPPAGYNGPIPDCAFSYEGCRDVNSLIEMAVNIGKFIFSLAGSVAFVMFIYGGVTMVMSFGNPEKFKKGQDILVAAVIGVIISLSAYLAVDFLLDALNVSGTFRAVQ